MNKENKSIKFTESQIKAHENGATMYMFPILLPFDDGVNDYEYNEDGGIWNAFKDDEHITSVIPPLRTGDKDVFIKEEFRVVNYNNAYFICFKDGKSIQTNDVRNFRHDLSFNDSSIMKEHQSRYSLKEIIDVRVVRVQDITLEDIFKIGINHIKEYKRGKVVKSTTQLKREFKELYVAQLKEQNINRTYEDNDYVFLIERKL